MKTLYHFLLGCLVVSAFTSRAQDIPSRMDEMKTAYTASGSIVVLDGQTLVIEPKMPGPICSLPRFEDGKTTWYRYAFPLASITVPLTAVDENKQNKKHDNTDPAAPQVYKPGDQGDAT